LGNEGRIGSCKKEFIEYAKPVLEEMRPPTGLNQIFHKTGGPG